MRLRRNLRVRGNGAQRFPPTVIPGAVISPSMDGHIRDFSAKTGEVIWDFDAVRDFPL
jgi:hypothetical protein